MNRTPTGWNVLVLDREGTIVFNEFLDTREDALKEYNNDALALLEGSVGPLEKRP